MNVNRWLQSLVRDRPDLYRAIYDWNAYPHRWILPAWLNDAAVPTAVITQLEKTSAGRERLGRHFRQVYRLEEMIWDFQEPRRRIALLSGPTLARLARFAGAAIHAGRLARVVTKDERRATTERIGEDAYTFALRHGWRLTASDGTGGANDAMGSLVEAVEQSGWRVVATCVQGEAETIRRRLRLKAPPSQPVFQDTAAQPPVKDAWNFLQPIAREALTPEELRCFA